MYRYLLLFLLICGLNLDAFANNITTKIDPSKPIQIESNEILLKKKKNIIIFTGKVEAVQDKVDLFADRMNVRYAEIDKKIEVKNIKLFGNVMLKNETITARGDKGVYDLNKNLITLEDNVIINENDAVIFGEKLIYNTLTGETDIFSKSNDEKDDDKKERITIILENINDLKERYDN